jgi:valyl-tRNA synthetase
MTVEEARKAVVEDLEAAGSLGNVKDYKVPRGRSQRSGAVVEPMLMEQWFVKTASLAEKAVAAVETGKTKFVPELWTKTYMHWMTNIRDWCISRQLWWGHRIPVWYCQAEGCGEVIVAREDPTSCPKCGGTALEQDPDVFDTWFSSWLWPFSTLGWPEETEDLKAFYPTNTLVTAPEILFFWVARMVMAGIEFMGEVPFRDVYLHGTVRDHRGRKMSKSLGNGIDPLEVVDLFGADALRYTIVAGAGVGADLYMNYEDLEETFSPGRNFANKLWNAGRFALMNLEGAEVRRVEEIEDVLDVADRWILSRLSKTTAQVTRHLENFRTHDAAESLYHFFWGEIADWYLELIKPRFRDDADPASRAAAQATLVEVLDGVFRLLHPIMPFVSEALWRRLPVPAGVERKESLVVAQWPEPRPDREDAEAEAHMGALMELIGNVRALRAEYRVPPGEKIEVRISAVPDALRAAVEAERAALERLAGVREIVYGDGRAEGEAGASAVLRGGGELFLPLAGIIDLERERERLGKELEHMEKLLRSTEAKLSNEKFVSRAPAEVVERERDKAESYRDQRDRLAEKLAALA